jgi:hypothetical protein
MEAELQVVLNTLTKQEFRGPFKKNGRTAGDGTTLTVMVASRLKVSLRPDNSTSPGNYGCVWYKTYSTESFYHNILELTESESSPTRLLATDKTFGE